MRQIIAMGGGGFSMEPDNPLLDGYLIAQARRRNPNVCFVATASGDSESYIKRFYTSFGHLDATPTHLSLFQPNFHDLRQFVMAQDVIYVGGGSTKNLLALWREWGLDKVLQEALTDGIVLAGLSAGSLCFFESGVTDSYGDELQPIACLGYLKGSHSPHYDGEPKRRPAFRKWVHEGKLPAGLAADDGVGLHFINEELVHIVSSRPNARAYKVTREREDELTPIYLGNHA